MTASLPELQAAYRANRISKEEFIAAAHLCHRVMFDLAELLGHSEIHRIEVTSDGPVFTSTRGMRFVCAATDRRAAPIEALNFGQYEHTDADLFWSLLRPMQTIIDVGAHIGWYSVHAAAAFPTSKIYAIEPVPESAQLLRKNVDINQLTNVLITETAFANMVGELELYVPNHLPTAASTADLFRSAPSIHVRTTTLDDFVMEHGLTPHVIKIDVEGGELEVLRGGQQTLDRQRPMVFCEMLRKWTAVHGYHPNDTIAYMTGLGYECGHAKTPGPGWQPVDAITDDIVATNFVFRPRSHSGVHG